MITQITGKLLEKTPTYVVIECNGIGYKINISLQTFSSIKDENCKLFTHLSVKEDSHTLYGFYDQGERHLFRNLVSVSGVGPSTAQVILSTYDTSEIVSYIATADVAAIQQVKGIGAKTAQRIIIDLKDKVAKGLPSADILFNLDNTMKSESLSALLALGFAKKGAEQKIDKVLKENPEITSVEQLVKMALSQM
jgi:Holliday junction DNA helicase RuvA